MGQPLLLDGGDKTGLLYYPLNLPLCVVHYTGNRMATEYCRSMLRICIAQLCQNLGWNATQSSPLELLTDILERYLIDLGKISHRYSEQFGRTEPNLDDLALTFRHYGIQLGELEDYIRHVEPVAFAREVVSFPARKRNNLGFPNSRSRELLQHREEHVHNHLPYMYPGMEDEVDEESSQASLPTPQLPQESVSPMAISPMPSDKRPLSNSAEGPPSKRPRLTSSNLPEEAGHSQYEMKGLLMNPSGVLTPTRQGKLPDARTPPTFRQSLQFKDEGGQKGRENKEETPTRPPFSEKPGRQDEEDNRDKSNNCLEKVAPKKKMLKHYKQMTAADTASGMPRSPKVTKLARSPKPGSPLGTKSPKPKQKAKSKDKSDKREEASSGGNLPAESCLKDLLLSPKVNVDKVEKIRVSSPLAASPKVKSDSKEKHKDKKEKKSRGDGQDKVPKPPAEGKTPNSGDVPPGAAEADVSSRLPFSVEEDSSNSRDYSPERLVIAEGDTKVKNTKEARQARLALIDDSIDSVIRNSVAEVEKKTDTFTFSEDSEIKMSPKPIKGKKKDKSKSGKDSEHRPKKKDKKEKSDSQSIADSIDAVIRQSSEETELVPPPPPPTAAPPVSAVSEVVVKEVSEPPPPVKTASPLVMPELGSKKFGKDKSDKKPKKKTSGKKKEKESTTKDKLKDKLKVKSEKPDLSELDKKPSVLDKFSAQEYSVYDFPESPPSLPPRPKKATPKSGTSPKQSLPPSNPHPPPTPLPTPAPPPVTTPSIPPPPPPLPTPPAKEETPSTPVSDQPPLMTLKILDLKHKQKDKERSKDKEHKKEKKEKKKDKEKKKKNKDKDKEKSRDKSKTREDKHKEDKDLPGSSPVGGVVAPIKLNIKFGGPGRSSAATSTVITEPKITSPKPEPLPVSPKTPRPEPLLSPKREIPKLVIKPIRRESLEAKAKLGAASRSPAIMSPPKSPPPPPVAPPPATPPAPPPVAAPPAPAPPPPPRTPSPPPPPKIKTPPKSPSPPPSPPKPKTPPPPTPSPPPPPKSPTPPPRSPTPPPRSPTPEKLLTPSPEPKLCTPQSSPIRKSPTPEPTPPPHKSPKRVKQSPPIKSPSPRNVPSPKSSPPSSPLSSRLEMDIDQEDEPKPEPKPKAKPSKQSPKGKADKGDKSDKSDKGDKSDKSDTKPSPKGKRGRKPKEKEEKEEPKAAVRSRNKSIPTVTSETVSETPITGPIVQRTVVAETIGTFLDAEGNKVWICPACKMQDDGSPMIGCDVCDDWYHWVCMDIKQEPEEDEWFCPRCEETRSKSKTPKGKPKGKKRGRKKKT